MSVVFLDRKIQNETDFLSILEGEFQLYPNDLTLTMDVDIQNPYVSRLEIDEALDRTVANFFTNDDLLACTIILKRK